MELFKQMVQSGFEQVVFCHDQTSGLRAIIAIHSTKRGPALGGCRMMAYPSEEAAAADALRLARGMTYKTAVFGLGYGGGKAVILGDPGTDKSEALFRSLGRSIEQLGGRYITGVDMGTTVADMDAVRLATSYVTDTTGSVIAAGDFTAEMTAYGVYLGMKASALEAFGTDELKGRTVAVQGLGKVGGFLCRYLHSAGAKLAVSDLDGARVVKAVRDYGARAVAADKIAAERCDIFAPCAHGGVINEHFIRQLQCPIIAGSANNQLGDECLDDELRRLGVLYAPDFVINAGGIIVTACELNGENAASMRRNVERIYPLLLHIYNESKRSGNSPWQTARHLAEQALH